MRASATLSGHIYGKRITPTPLSFVARGIDQFDFGLQPPRTQTQFSVALRSCKLLSNRICSCPQSPRRRRRSPSDVRPYEIVDNIADLSP